MVELKDGTFVEDPRLDRLSFQDPRSLEYGVEKLGALPAELKNKTWELPRRYFVNQGQEGACVSAGFGHDSAATPFATSKLNMAWLREHVYFNAQRDDYWEGGAYPGASPFYEGTSVLAGAKVMQRFGFFESYHWAFSIDELIAALSLGTLVVGWNWTEGQMYPDPGGIIRYQGSELGGHCVNVRGIWLPNKEGRITRIPGKPKIDEPVLVIPQSWGLDHGNRGEVYMPVSEAEKAIKAGGDQCVPVGRKKIDVKKVVTNV